MPEITAIASILLALLALGRIVTVIGRESFASDPHDAPHGDVPHVGGKHVAH